MSTARVRARAAAAVRSAAVGAAASVPGRRAFALLAALWAAAAITRPRLLSLSRPAR